MQNPFTIRPFIAASFATGLFLCSFGAAFAQDAPQNPIEKHIGHLLAGSGKWRTPNPEYEPGSSEPVAFAMNYAWGPYKKHAVAEIVSIYDDGRAETNWTLFLTYNPVTDEMYYEQAGGSGVYFRGEAGRTEDGRHVETGLVYLTNGTVRSVRDEVEIIDGRTRVSHVFERDESGEWVQAREWTWRLVD